MAVRYHNDETNDPPNFRAIFYDALNVGLGAIGKIKETRFIEETNTDGNDDFDESYPRDGIVPLDFNSKGTHIAAGAHSGCLTILKFVNMHRSLYDPNFGLQNNSTHICFEMPVDVVRWNSMNETLLWTVLAEEIVDPNVSFT